MKHPAILIICGSGRTPSYTASLCAAVGQSLSAAGAVVTVHVPNDLPFADPDSRLQREAIDIPAVASFFQAAQAADAIVLASPVYHNSCSGLLKNAVDWLGMNECRGKAFGLVSHGGGSPQPVDHLRIIVRALQAIAIPTQISTAEAHFGPPDDRTGLFPLTDPAISKRLQKFTGELLEFSTMLANRKTR
ncbi:MAG: NADPH-dependent FMN reductase [Rhodospirillales bacterium]